MKRVTEMGLQFDQFDSWADVMKVVRRTIYQLPSPPRETLHFTDLPFWLRSGNDVSDDWVDWLTKDDIDRYRASYARNPVTAAQYYHSPRGGSRRTAEWIWRLRSDHEAVWALL